MKPFGRVADNDNDNDDNNDNDNYDRKPFGRGANGSSQCRRALAAHVQLLPPLDSAAHVERAGRRTKMTSRFNLPFLLF